MAPCDRVLDVGCGTGTRTRTAARPASRGHAVGVDMSAPLLRRAGRRTAAERVRNVTYRHADLYPRKAPFARI
ncbi:class I SAM-dependent methyltransferase [Streptomyces sp. 7R007]